MRRVFKLTRFFLILSLGHLVVTHTAWCQEEPVIRIDTNVVNVFFSALDKNNTFFNGLNRADVRVFENDFEQEISTFQHETHRALSLAILIDISGSVRHSFAREKVAAGLFLNRVMRPNDHAAILSFAADPFLEQSPTAEIEKAKAALDRVDAVKGVQGYQGKGTILPIGAVPASGSLGYTSAVWDAIWITCRHVMSSPATNTRKVIVILTDGEDTSSRASLDEAIDIAIRSDTVVYAIGVGDSSGEGVNKKTLGQLAGRTGGQFFYPKNEADLDPVFAKISRELRWQ